MEEIMCYIYCPQCKNKKGIYGPMPLTSFAKLLQSSECEICKNKDLKVQAIDKK